MILFFLAGAQILFVPATLVEIAFGTNKIAYLYDAGGVKVQKKVKQGSNTVTTDYLDGFTSSVRFARVSM